MGLAPSPSCSADDLFAEYDSVLRSIADRFAPAYKVRHGLTLNVDTPAYEVHSRVGPHAPWFDTECRYTRRKFCKTERRPTSDADRSALFAAARRKHDEFAAKKNKYWSKRIAKSSIPAAVSCGSRCRSCSGGTTTRVHQLRRDTLQTTSEDSFTTRCEARPR